MIQTTITEIERAFIDFLGSLHHPIEKSLEFNTTKFNYYPCPNSSNRRNHDARYKIFSDGIPGGYFKCWHCGVEADFCFKQQRDVSPDQWKTHIARIAKRKKEDEAKTNEARLNAANKAVAMFGEAVPATTHGYLDLKNVKSYGLRIYKNDTLLVPCHDAAGALVNLERIYLDKQADRFQKRPIKGGQRIGVLYLIGEVKDPQETIYICEGYSAYSGRNEQQIRSASEH
jgi:putative DNA primase/helicase